MPKLVFVGLFQASEIILSLFNEKSLLPERRIYDVVSESGASKQGDHRYFFRLGFNSVMWLL